MKATGRFNLDAWEEEAVDAVEDFVLARVRVGKTFHGDAEATSSTELVIAKKGEAGVAYGGLERFTGSLHGKQGTFVLHHDASRSADGGWFRWSIVPGSGAGELTGIRGEGTVVPHDDSYSYTFDYDL